MKKLKTLLKSLIPPTILQLLSNNDLVIFSDNYRSWQEAYNATSGYNVEVILERVKAASLKVKQGEALYERDSVIFDRVHYSFPILVVLLRVALENKGHLSILDFGGSLGSCYYQCRNFLADLSSLRWSVVEQPHFATCGQQLFEDKILKFYSSIDDCLKSESPQIILLSSVIQYLERPYDFLQNVLDYQYPYILVDRTAFTHSGCDRLTIQQVPESIYPASYPAWFLDQQKFMKIFESNYVIMT